MRIKTTLAAVAFLALSGTACADLEVTNLNAPDRERAISTPGDVEQLIVGAYPSIWATMHTWYPGMALDVGADSHSASWGNFGMQDFGEEPRKAFNNSPSYSYSEVAEDPWADLYGAMAGIRDGLLAINDPENPIVIGQNGQDTPRAVAFAKFQQGLAMALVGILYDKGFIVDEDSDLEALGFVPYMEVFNAGIAKLDEAQAMAESNSFTIPGRWIGQQEGSDWTSAFMARGIDSFKARLMMAVHRDEASRSGADNWGQIEQLVTSGWGPTESYIAYDDGDDWSWSALKTYGAGISGWSRIDYRQVGPADASGNYATWLQTPAANRQPFNIDTDDSRITGGSFDADGTYIGYIGSSPFPSDRGTYHFSHYIDTRWNYIWENSFVGAFPDWDPKEREFILAEAAFHQGDYQTVVDIINPYRTAAGLPAITSADPNAPVPGGSRCVPKPDGATCGDLWEAFKYEKRIELFHYGPHTEFTDDRGWGDLVSGTPIHLPVPGAELLLLLEEIYTFGGDQGGAAPNIVTNLSPEALRQKAEGMRRYTEAKMQDGRSPVAH